MNAKSESTGPTKRKFPWPLLTTSVAAVALVMLVIWPSTPSTFAKESDIVVYKTASCSCCGKWVAHLREAGFNVEVEHVASTQPTQSRVGVPRELGSCHTALVGDYWVEGHVPADLVQQLMSEKPVDVRGIAVPGMPIGSPGMEGPNPQQYDVVAFHTDGETSVYATRQGKSAK